MKQVKHRGHAPVTSSVVLVLAMVVAPHVSAQDGASNGEWRVYGADNGATKYSGLDQISKDNVRPPSDRLDPPDCRSVDSRYRAGTSPTATPIGRRH